MLNLTIRIQGYEFFSEQFFRRIRRECDVSLRGVKMKIGDDQVTGYLLTRNIAKNIAEQTSYPLEIFSTSPDTIFFTFEKKTFKKMSPLRPKSLTVIRAGMDSVSNHPDSIRGNVFRSAISKKNSK